MILKALANETEILQMSYIILQLNNIVLSLILVGQINYACAVMEKYEETRFCVVKS